MKILLCTAIACLVFIQPSVAGVDIFLKFNGGATQGITTGDSLDETYNKSEGWFDISDAEFGIKNTVNTGSGSVPVSGRAYFDRIKFTKGSGAGSAKLLLACASGQPYTSVTIVFAHSQLDNMNDKVRILQMDLFWILVESVNATAASDDTSLDEQVTMVHGAQRVQFFTSDPSTRVEQPAGSSEWSFVKNEPSTDVQ